MKNAIEYAYKQIQEGKIRTTQNWIGPKGVSIEGATFVPPIPEQVPELLINLYEYSISSYTI